MKGLYEIQKENFERACSTKAWKLYGKDYKDLTDKQCARVSKLVAKGR
jgi:hypothetical protein